MTSVQLEVVTLLPRVGARVRITMASMTLVETSSSSLSQKIEKNRKKVDCCRPECSITAGMPDEPAQVRLV